MSTTLPLYEHLYFLQTYHQALFSQYILLLPEMISKLYATKLVWLFIWTEERRFYGVVIRTVKQECYHTRELFIFVTDFLL